MYQFRPAQVADSAACLILRGQTRENAFSMQQLAELGITEETWAAGINQGAVVGFVCESQQQLVAYCFAELEAGEVLVLAVLPEHEHQGLGKQLLALVLEQLKQHGFERSFLGCARDANMRSHGFYRHLGWLPTGELDELIAL